MGLKTLMCLALCALMFTAMAQVAHADNDLDVDIEAADHVRSGDKVTVVIDVENERPGASYVDHVKLYDGATLLKEWTPAQSSGEHTYLTYEASFTKTANLRVEAHSSDGRIGYDSDTINVT